MSVYKNSFNAPKTNLPNVKPNSLEDALNKSKRSNNDLIIMFARGCDYCSKYGKDRNGKGKVYSVSGKSTKYPSMMVIPADLVIGKCPKCNKSISFNLYFDGINS